MLAQADQGSRAGRRRRCEQITSPDGEQITTCGSPKRQDTDTVAFTNSGGTQYRLPSKDTRAAQLTFRGAWTTAW